MVRRLGRVVYSTLDFGITVTATQPRASPPTTSRIETMKNRTLFTLSVFATLVAFLTMGAAATASAQGNSKAAKENRGQGKKDDDRDDKKDDKMEMMDMVGGPHQVLAMAYRDNLVTFARALRGHGGDKTPVNLDVARPAVLEMRRSYNQIVQHHSAQAALMTGHMDSSMTSKKAHMEGHLSSLGEHLTALESAVNAATPDPKSVSAHTAEILKECAGMSSMHAMAAEHGKKR